MTRGFVGSEAPQPAYASRFLTWILFAVLLIIMLILWWWPFGDNAQRFSKGVNPDQISIRNSDGIIQWQFLNGEWEDITTIDELRGEKGDRGESGQSGANGKDGG